MSTSSIMSECAACGAVVGERCRPGCVGLADTVDEIAEVHRATHGRCVRLDDIELIVGSLNDRLERISRVVSVLGDEVAAIAAIRLQLLTEWVNGS